MANSKKQYLHCSVDSEPLKSYFQPILMFCIGFWMPSDQERYDSLGSVHHCVQVAQIKLELSQKYYMKDLGLVSRYLEVYFVRTR
jgi:hypothetical protein